MSMDDLDRERIARDTAIAVDRHAEAMALLAASRARRGLSVPPTMKEADLRGKDLR